MKLKSLFLVLLVMFAGVVSAQVTSGKVYRIVSGKYGTVITANPVNHALSCVTVGGDSDYQQMWKITDEGNGKYSIMNVFSGRYVQNQSAQNNAYTTGTSKVLFAIKQNEANKGYYNIDANNRAGGWGLHCASGGSVVPWSYGTAGDGVSGTEWTFSEVSITEEEMAQALVEYAEYNEVLQNKATIISKINNLFSDKAGTVLKSQYASMSDAALLAEMEGVPADLQQAVLKVKNNSWATCERDNLGEKNFRIYEYRPHSNPEKWADELFLRPFCRINNPTGICSENDRGYIYVFVDEIPAGAEVYLAEMLGTSFWGTDTRLTAGLNVVPSANKDGVLYLRYICETSLNGKKLSDYPNLKVHIEGGYVNGFWSKERGHTNADWTYMRENMFRNEGSVQAMGEMSLLDFRKKEFLAECPSNIEGIIKLWDFWNERQRFYMGLDKYAEWFNNKQLAMSDDNGFMDASSYRTHYNNNTLSTIVNYDLLIRDAGSSWGPNHEIGHTNQYAFQIVGTSEVSNNALTNFAIFDQGTHVSRGQNMSNQILDFENNVPYVVRGEKEYGSKLFSMTRMYFQLFLYFHAAGKVPDFYPRLFEELRKDRLVGWVTHANDELDANGYYVGSMDAKHDQLKFVEKCCEVAQMDLTEFFEAWGFFVPMKNAFVGDYGHHYVYLHQSTIDSCIAGIKAKNYPKKGGQIMFLEDRVRQSPKKVSPFSDGNGYRYNYADWEGERIGEVGKFGQWQDCIDESVKAEGYYYAVSNGYVTIMEADGAKGALGFKLYDAESGKLLTYTNNLSMKIPVTAAGKELKVVAAQADGTDYVVPHASKGPEKMQLSALEKSLSTAKNYTFRKASSGIEIGYFYPDSIKYLKEIYDGAKSAYDKKDPSVHSYAEWSVMLDNECNRLATSDAARLSFEEGMTVIIRSSKNRGLLTSTYSGVVSHTSGDEAAAESRWQIEYAGTPDVYYLKCCDGNYIKKFASNDAVYADMPAASGAARFRIGYTELGDIYFVCADDDALSFGLSGSYVSGQPIVKAANPSETAAQWYAYIKENNSAEFYKNGLQDALTEASFLLTEILNIDSLSTMNIFNECIMVNDRNLETYAMDLYELYNKASKDQDNAKMHKSYLASLRNLFAKIEGTYTVVAPVSKKLDQVVWYRIMNKDNGKYISVSDKTTSTNKDRLAVVAASALNDRALWTFSATGKKNEFTMYNKELASYVSQKSTSKNNIYVQAEDAVPVTFEYDSENGGVVIRLNTLPMKEASGYVNVNPMNSPSYWVLEIVAVENSVLDGIEEVFGEVSISDENIYDLSGRRVLNPTRGIYIQNGKKVLLK